MRAFHRLLNMVLLLALLLTNVPVSVRADERIEAQIPVSCTGAPCTVALFDEAGNQEIFRQSLIPGQLAYLVAPCKGLDSYNFILKLIDTDTDSVVYDKTVYRVTVTTYRNDEDAICAVVTAKTERHSELILGEEDGKPSSLEFKNTPENDLPVQTCVVSDLRVHKTVLGNPSKPCEFVFVLRPADDGYPMPEGSKNGVAYINVVGSGVGTFAPIMFSAPGVYEYLISEVSDSLKPYRYDSTTYSIRFEITENNGVLQQTRTLLKNGVALTAAEAQAEFVFRNTYLGVSTPNTGDDTGYLMWRNLTVISLFCLVLAVLLLALDRRKAKPQVH